MRPIPRPFTLAATDHQLDDLRRRLAATRWPAQPAGTGWDRGTDTAYLQAFVRYWLEDYRWREREARLNGFPQFTVSHEGETLHFVHVRPVRDDAIPVLLLHGWPGSFVQMLELIPHLTDPAQPVCFEVIVPSLPGYGFSSSPKQPGTNCARIAQQLCWLMTEVLGHPRFAARGGDLGRSVMLQVAQQFPERLIGVHCTGVSPRIGEVPDDLTAAERAFVEEAQRWQRSEGAYAHEHSTKPQTLAHALTDSPVGLAAWILEKFRSWSDCQGDLSRRYSQDELLDNLMVYWLSGTIGSAMHLYLEQTVNPQERPFPLDVPVAMLMAPADLVHPPQEWVERTHPVTRWTPLERGGHFLEWEEPVAVAEDMRAFFAGRLLGASQT